jgi:LAO/AO transport system ATPase
VKEQRIQDLAALLTQIQRIGSEALSNSLIADPPTLAPRLGISGPPGAGKSTLVGEIVEHFSSQGLKIGVLAVDPSSPLTRGAVLGDRVRFNELTARAGVFVRSMGSRGSLGGLSAEAYLFLRAYDLFAFDLVLVETVGVGQTELEVMNAADEVMLILVPESGDSMQVIKAGLMEIADTFVVNKSDRPGADILKKEIEGNLDSVGGVMAVSGKERQSLQPLFDAVKNFIDRGVSREERYHPNRLQAEARALFMQKQLALWSEQIENIRDNKGLREFLRA